MEASYSLQLGGSQQPPAASDPGARQRPRVGETGKAECNGPVACLPLPGSCLSPRRPRADAAAALTS
jgi:hypothetical protein